MPTLYWTVNETGNRNHILEKCKIRFWLVHWIDPRSIEHNYACFCVLHKCWHLLSSWWHPSADHSHILLLMFMLVIGFGRLWSRTCVTYCLQTGQLRMRESYYRVLWMSRLSRSVDLFLALLHWPKSMPKPRFFAETVHRRNLDFTCNDWWF